MTRHALPAQRNENPTLIVAADAIVTARGDVVLAALGAEPTPTSELYDRVGYLALARVGLIPYAAFRDELATLAAAGLAESQPGEDGATLWRRAGESADRH